jgi:hypothetical protein
LRAPTVVDWPSFPASSATAVICHLEIGRRDVQPPVPLLEQHVRQNGQRVPALDDSRDRLQGFQQRITRNCFNCIGYLTKNS